MELILENLRSIYKVIFVILVVPLKLLLVRHFEEYYRLG